MRVSWVLRKHSHESSSTKSRSLSTWAMTCTRRREGPTATRCKPPWCCYRSNPRPSTLFASDKSGKRTNNRIISKQAWKRVCFKEYVGDEVVPNGFENPDPAPPDLSPDDLDTHRRNRTACENQTYGVIKSENWSLEELWLDFICTLRPHSLQTWPKGLTY